MTDDLERLLHFMIGGNTKATAEIFERAKTSTNPALLVAAALLADEPDELLGRAAANAATTGTASSSPSPSPTAIRTTTCWTPSCAITFPTNPDNDLAAWIAAKHACPYQCNH